MGYLMYGRPPEEIEIDDRVLSHVKLVIIAKLRRSEPFAFSFELADGSGRSTVWLHPSIPLQFTFDEPHQPPINRAWIDELVVSSNSVDGLRLVPEPPESA